MIFNYKKYPKKINLGCGFDKRKDFLNVDLNSFHEPDLVCDVTNLEILPEYYYNYILANDVLEHIPRLKTREALRQWNRILVTGGTLELQVPNVIGLLSLLQKKENCAPDMHEKLLQCLFGTQAYEGDFHYIGFTDIFINSLLIETGFDIVSITVRDEWLFKIIAKKICNMDPNTLKSDGKNFIEYVYRIYLKRVPDESGREYYLALINSGATKEDILNIFKKSDEYNILSNKK